MNLHKTIFTPLSMTLLLSACVVQQTTPPIFEGCVPWEYQDKTKSIASVNVLSAELSKVIGIRSVRTSRNANGLTTTQVTAFNCTDQGVVVGMRTLFSDNTGQSEAPSNWRTVHLAARSESTYVENAVKSTTSGVSVEIMDANRSQTQFGPSQIYGAPTAVTPIVNIQWGTK